MIFDTVENCECTWVNEFKNLNSNGYFELSKYLKHIDSWNKLMC